MSNDPQNQLRQSARALPQLDRGSISSEVAVQDPIPNRINQPPPAG